MAPGDRLICAFTGPVEVGREFKEWLLHVTIVPWFRVEMGAAEIAGELESRLQNVEPFKVEMGSEEMFSRPVNLVQVPTPFYDIQPVVRRFLHEQSAWIADETVTRKWPFRPHVTSQKSERLCQGDSFECDRLHIVKQLGGRKVVEAHVLLGV